MPVRAAKAYARCARATEGGAELADRAERS
jgi:hypothetical protein